MNTCKRQRTIPTMSEEQWRSERNTMLRQIIVWLNTEQYQAVAELLHPLAYRGDLTTAMYNEMNDIVGRYMSEEKELRLKEEECDALIQQLEFNFIRMEEELGRLKASEQREHVKPWSHNATIQYVHKTVRRLVITTDLLWASDEETAHNLKVLENGFIQYLTYIEAQTSNTFSWIHKDLNRMNEVWGDIFPVELASATQEIKSAIASKRAELAARV